MAIERVKKRVEEGGHNIENDVIKRRYTRGLKNLFEIYLPLVSDALVIDGSTDELEKIATSAWGQPVNVLNSTKWEKLKKLSQKKS
jgi:predicted ABC-type ATPase